MVKLVTLCKLLPATGLLHVTHCQLLPPNTWQRNIKIISGRKHGRYLSFIQWILIKRQLPFGEDSAASGPSSQEMLDGSLANRGRWAELHIHISLHFANHLVLSSARSWEVFENSFISFCQVDPQKTLWGQRCYTSSVIIDLGFEISLSWCIPGRCMTGRNLLFLKQCQMDKIE